MQARDLQLSFTRNKSPEELLADLYRQNPCGVLPNAYWKTRKSIREGEARLRFHEEALAEMAVFAHEGVPAYWRAPGGEALLFTPEMPWAFCLLHERDRGLIPDDGSVAAQAYFRLSFQPGASGCNRLPPVYRFVNVDPEKDFPAVASIIAACYDSIRPDEASVRSWMKHPVYDPALWVWIENTRTGEREALGIAEFDPSFAEGSLEWIQTHPASRGRGLGQALVNELLTRLAAKAKIITVSGKCVPDGRVESFYRRCGFQGHDVWWHLQKKEGTIPV